MRANIVQIPNKMQRKCRAKVKWLDHILKVMIVLQTLKEPTKTNHLYDRIAIVETPNSIFYYFVKFIALLCCEWILYIHFPVTFLSRRSHREIIFNLKKGICVFKIEIMDNLTTVVNINLSVSISNIERHYINHLKLFFYAIFTTCEWWLYFLIFHWKYKEILLIDLQEF